MRRAAAATRAVVVAALLAAVAAVPGAGRPAAAQAAPAIELASQTTWVSPTSPFVVRLAVDGVSRDGDVELRATLHNRISTRSQFALTLEGRALGRALRTTSAALDDLTTDAAGAVVVRFEPGDLPVSRTGVYPLEVSLRSRRGSVLDRLVTHLVFLASVPEEGRLGVSWVVPVHAPPTLPVSGLRRRLEVDNLATLVDALQSPAARSMQLVLAPTPETVEALAADPLATQVLAGLREVARNRQLVARPYVPVDPAALVNAGLGEELAAQRATGAEVAGDLLGLDTDLTTWVADEPLDEEALARLVDLRVEQVVLAEDNLARIPLQVTLAQPFAVDAGTGRPVEAAVADDGLAAHFRNRGDQVLAAHHFLADLATLWLDAPQRERAVVVATPRHWRASRPFLETALAGLAAAPVLVPMSLDEVFRTIEPATGSRREPLVRRLEPPEPQTVSPTPSQIRNARRHVRALGSILPPTSGTVETFGRRILVSQSADLIARQRRDVLGEVEAAIAAHARQVELPVAATITLTAREGEIPLTLLNRSPGPMTVVVRLESDKLEFPGRAERVLELPPRSTTVRFGVRARTSGAFPLRVSLAAPEGGLTLATTRVTVRSTATSGVGLGLSIGAAAFLVVWWTRHLVRGRRARRLVPA